jgi:hypothetical protein
MATPIGRVPFNPAQLNLLQHRPTPTSAEERGAPATRERPMPPAPNSGPVQRGRLVDIVA